MYFEGCTEEEEEEEEEWRSAAFDRVQGHSRDEAGSTIGSFFSAWKIGESENLSFTHSFFFWTATRFLVSTHYMHYAPSVFFVNLVLTVINLIAKLPAMHQVRLFDINQKVVSADEDIEYWKSYWIETLVSCTHQYSPVPLYTLSLPPRHLVHGFFHRQQLLYILHTVKPIFVSASLSFPPMHFVRIKKFALFQL